MLKLQSMGVMLFCGDIDNVVVIVVVVLQPLCL